MNGSPWYMAVDFGTDEETRNPTDYIAEAAPQHDYNIGDHVELTTGGPTMVVLDVCDECGDVDVAWFNGTAMEIITLPSAAVWHAYED